MNDLEKLAAALEYDRKIDFSGGDRMKEIADALEMRFKLGEKMPESSDLLLQAVKAFWVDSKLHSIRQARLVSFSLTLPVHLSGQCLMDDVNRFGCLLDSLNRLRDRPLDYRRCYRGLLHSYFSYDAHGDEVSDAGRMNIRALRQHLHENHALLNCGRIVPDWVHAVAENLHVFGDDPCAPYAKVVLEGGPSTINELCERLGITKASWFWRELVMAQIRWSVGESRDVFLKYMPRLLDLLRDNVVLRDRGLTIILDHYASVPDPEINVVLRDTAVEFWGNPWLPSNKVRWWGVTAKAKDMISGWLKRHFIKEFFAKLAQDGIGDPRRANFWLKYVDAIEKVEFALGARALDKQDKDMEILRKQMHGLTTELRGSEKYNNAFVMCMGDLVAVEFGGEGNAFYGYDRKIGMPFDMTQPVFIAKDSGNSLKRSDRMLWLKHKDGIHGWDRWEDMFSATFREHFGIVSDGIAKDDEKNYPQPVEVDSKGPDVVKSNPHGLSVDLLAFIERQGLVVIDHGSKGGSLWVMADHVDDDLVKILTRDGFRYKPGKGWWR